MNKKIFMLDIEGTGVTTDDEILEIGIVEMEKINSLWVSGKVFHMYLHTDREPESLFAQQHQKHLYRRCRNEQPIEPATVRKQIMNFFKECGIKGNTAENVILCGWNSNYDVLFMHKMGYLEPPGYETVNGAEVKTGDHSYRIYEINGAIDFVCDLLGLDRDAVKGHAEVYKHSYLEKILGKDHDALYDCYGQIGLLNGLIQFTRIYGSIDL